jgi:hypothetical protein
MIGAASGFVLSVVAGFFVVRVLLRNDPDAHTPSFRLLSGAAGIGIGIGTLSITSFVSMFVGNGLLVPGAEAPIFAVLAVLWFRSRKSGGAGSATDRAASCGMGPLPGRAAIAVVLLSLVWFVLFTLMRPHGDWDAWAIWNLRARFLFGGGALQGGAFDPAMLWSHPDYPLLLPLAVARLWTYAGAESMTGPALISWGFTFGTAALLFASLSLSAGRLHAAVASAALFGAPFFVKFGAAQQADLPVAFFCLLTATALTFATRRAAGGSGWIVVAGLAAGFAGWTKNEGVVLCLVFGVLTVAGRFAAAERPVRRTLLFAAGAIPAVVTMLFFKLSLAPPSQLLSAGPDLAARLLDPGRYALVAGAYGRELLNLGMGLPVAAAAFLLGRTADLQRRRESAVLFLAISLLTVAHIAVYVLTPYDLAWHLGTSLNRLLIQLWPTFLLALFLQVQLPDSARA